MRFLVKSIDEISIFKTDKKHILISIKSPDSHWANLPVLKSRIKTLYVSFHDFDGDRYPKMIKNPKIVLFKKEQAKKILEFVNANINKVDLIVCQCEAGISRSAGVAGALSKIYNNDDTLFFKKYIPNKYVYNMLLNCYYKKGII
jgi:predicted protein tyrosine phosphatase